MFVCALSFRDFWIDCDSLARISREVWECWREVPLSIRMLLFRMRLFNRVFPLCNCSSHEDRQVCSRQAIKLSTVPLQNLLSSYIRVPLMSAWESWSPNQSEKTACWKCSTLDSIHFDRRRLLTKLKHVSNIGLLAWKSHPCRVQSKWMISLMGTRGHSRAAFIMWCTFATICEKLMFMSTTHRPGTTAA